MVDTPLFTRDAPVPLDGVICGFRLSGDAPVRELGSREVAEAVADPTAITWVHFNLSNARARRWLASAETLPGEFRELIDEPDPACRIEAAGEGLVLVSSDLALPRDSTPSGLATLWAYATGGLLLTARRHPLRSTDELRLALGATQGVASGCGLLSELLQRRAENLRQMEDDLSRRVDDIEDEILGGRIPEQRERLGAIRRRCARVRRAFTPERVLLQRFLASPPGWLDRQDAESLAAIRDQLGFVVDDLSGLYERAKLLQEELASRLAEATARNLYALSILTAVFLPMTLITGIFGMNVAGLPGTEGVASFWWVMLLVIGAGGLTLGALFGRKLM